MRPGKYAAPMMAMMLVMAPDRSAAVELLSPLQADGADFNWAAPVPGGARTTGMAGPTGLGAASTGLDAESAALPGEAPQSDHVESIPLSLQEMGRSVPRQDAEAFEALPEAANPETAIANWFSDNLANVIRWSVIVAVAALVGAGLRKRCGSLSF